MRFKVVPVMGIYNLCFIDGRSHTVLVNARSGGEFSIVYIGNTEHTARVNFKTRSQSLVNKRRFK